MDAVKQRVWSLMAGMGLGLWFGVCLKHRLDWGNWGSGDGFGLLFGLGVVAMFVTLSIALHGEQL